MPSENITDPMVLRGIIVGILGRVSVEDRPCKVCREHIYRVPVKDAPKPIWFSKNGQPHALYCGRPGAGKKRQEALFDTSPTP
jgi:hypothetical protein